MAEDERQYQTQRRGGTHKENFVRLQSEFHKITSSGDVSIRGLHQMLGQLLKSFENLRMQSEKQIRKLQDELMFNQGTADACATFSNILVSLIEGYNSSGLLSGIPAGQMADINNEKKEETIKDVEEEEKVEVETDIDALKRVCANCGCQDEEDMKKCDCSCHVGKPCGNENCIICKDLSEYKLIKKKRRGRPKKIKVDTEQCQDS